MVIHIRIIISTLMIASTFIYGCSTMDHSRAEYEIVQAEDLIATNSATSGKKPVPSKDGGVEFSYALIVQNVSHERSFPLKLLASSFEVNEERLPIQCKEYKTGQENLVLKPKEKARIECLIHLKANPQNHLARKDTFGNLILPFQSNESMKELRFKYSLKIEDFE